MKRKISEMNAERKEVVDVQLEFIASRNLGIHVGNNIVSYKKLEQITVE